MGLQFLVFLLDAATLYVALLATGVTATPRGVFASFIMAPWPPRLAQFLSALATSVAMLGLTGVPLEEALTATLLLRGLTFWLPMLPGLWVAHRELAQDAALESLAGSRLHHNVLAIALANKLARIAWSVLAHGRTFEARGIHEATAQPA